MRHSAPAPKALAFRRSKTPDGDKRMTTITMTVNGQAVTRDAAPQTLLVQFIRETLQLTGTHVGCDTAQCGACTVHLNGRAVKSCNLLAVQATGAEVTTIEGVAPTTKCAPAWRATSAAAPATRTSSRPCAPPPPNPPERKSPP